MGSRETGEPARGPAADQGVRPTVYLDYQATTPVDPRVLEAMLPFFTAHFGNAASRSHSFGWMAEKAVDRARRQVAELAGAEPREIVFTSGATESNNLALKGCGSAHVVTIATEHKAVLDPVRSLARRGVEVTVLPTRPDGLVDLEALRAALRPETALVSVMHANNEIGVIQPVREIGAMCRARGILFHTDAAQSFGKLPIHVANDNIDLMSISAHKIYGPKGVGALYIRRGIAPTAQIEGGGHERGLRSGTLNVPGIVGLGAASALCANEMQDEAARIGALRDRLLALLEAGLDGVRVNGELGHRLPGNLNLCFAGIDAGALLTSLPEIALSTGSACSSAVPEPSHVLRAIGLSREEAHSSVRFGLGRFTTQEEIDFAAQRVIAAVRGLRAADPYQYAV